MAGDLGDDNHVRGTTAAAGYRGFATADRELAVVLTSSRDAADDRSLMGRSGARVAFPTCAAGAVWPVVAGE